MLQDESLKWIQKIVGLAPPARQLIFASATIEAQTREVLATLAPQAVTLPPTTAATERLAREPPAGATRA